MTMKNDQDSKQPVILPLPPASDSASWSHLKECYLQSEGGTSGWNRAWNGSERYKATRSIETHAETPEAARKLVARITELLNIFGE